MKSPAELARDCIKSIRPYSPGRTAPIKLASNENPLGPSPKALAAMEQAIRETRLYPDLPSTELTHAIARHHDVAPECVVVGAGSDEVIYMLGMAYVNPGEEVVISSPPFATYCLIAPVMEAKLVMVPAKDYRHDLEAMAEACTDKTKLVFISNPYNPTATIVRKAEVDRFLSAVPEQTIVVLDEAYFEYVDDPEYPDGLDYVRQGLNVLSMRTFSKIHALAGLRIGYGVAPAELAKWLLLVREPFNVSSIAQAAALASLEDREQIAQAVALNAEGKAYLCGEFDALGLTYAPSQANFIFVDIGMDSVQAFDALRQRGFAVRTGDIFGMPTHIRVTIGTAEQNGRFVAALGEVLNRP
ncbi:MAG: histidinol-phosphate transaminase [Armatimonadetes bacterium]|nr:histidinol-phosphate transaminase [Armatimonadota bacterium]